MKCLIWNREKSRYQRRTASYSLRNDWIVCGILIPERSITSRDTDSLDTRGLIITINASSHPQVRILPFMNTCCAYSCCFNVSGTIRCCLALRAFLSALSYLPFFGWFLRMKELTSRWRSTSVRRSHALQSNVIRPSLMFTSISSFLQCLRRTNYELVEIVLEFWSFIGTINDLTVVGGWNIGVGMTADLPCMTLCLLPLVHWGLLKRQAQD